MTKVYTGDVGTEIVLDCGVDVSTATVRKILVKKPGGAAAEWPAVADGTNRIKYVTVAGDLDTTGTWYLQAYVEMPGWQGRGGTASLVVAAAFG